MSVRIALIGVLVLLLSGCVSYDNGYRDGAYYRPRQSDEGDYYYGRPQQRYRGYYDPFYDPFYGPYYGPFRSPLYSPYYGPYWPYRSGFGFQYNYGYDGYWGYGYPMFGLSYVHVGGHYRDRDYGHDYGNDHGHGGYNHDRRHGDWGRDDDRRSDWGGNHERDRRPPGAGTHERRPWNPVSDQDRPWSQSSHEYRRPEPDGRDWEREHRRDGVITERNGSRRDDSHAPVLRMPSGHSPVVDLRRSSPVPVDRSPGSGFRPRSEYRREGVVTDSVDFERDRSRAPAQRMPSGRSPVVDLRRSSPVPVDRGSGGGFRPSGEIKQRGESRRPEPVVRSQPRMALPAIPEKSRNESQKRTSALENER